MYFLSVPHLQYQHIFINEGTWKKFQEKNESGTCTNNGSKNKVKHKQGALHLRGLGGLTGITFARRKSIITARKMYLLGLFFFFKLARITSYLEYV